MTIPCYDFPDSSRHRPRSRSESPPLETPGRGRNARPAHAPGRPSAIASSSTRGSAELDSNRRVDRGRWKTDGRVNIAGFDESRVPQCACWFIKQVRPERFYDCRYWSSPPRPRTQEPLPNRKPASHFAPSSWSWNPFDLIRRPWSCGSHEHHSNRSHSSHRQPVDTTHTRSSAPGSNTRKETPHRPIPPRSKVQSLRRAPGHPRKPSPRKSPIRCKTPTPTSRKTNKTTSSTRERKLFGAHSLNGRRESSRSPSPCSSDSDGYGRSRCNHSDQISPCRCAFCWDEHVRCHQHLVPANKPCYQCPAVDKRPPPHVRNHCECHHSHRFADRWY